MKRLLQIVCCLVLISPPLVSCNDDDTKKTTEPVELATPELVSKNVSQTSFGIAWTAVEHAAEYVYVLGDGQEQKTSQLEIAFDKLTPETTYSVKVKAVSTDKLYLDSKWATKTVTTLAHMQLTAPANLTVTEQNTTSVVLTWDAVENAAGYIYQVDEQAELSVDKNTVTLSELTPDTEYAVKVKATGGDGSPYLDSEWGTVTVRTAAEAQEAPFEVTFTDLKARSFTLNVTPKDPNMNYYLGWADEAEWADYLDKNGNFDEDVFLASQMEFMEFFASIIGSTYPAVLADMTYTGPMSVPYDSYIDPETHYYGYAFGWDLDGNFTSKVVIAETDTPAAAVSTAKVDIVFSDPTATSLRIICTPDANVTSYYQILAEKSVVADYIAKNGQAAFEGYIINNGDEIEGVDDYVWESLDPETEYTMSIVGFDTNGGQFYCSETGTTLAATLPDPVNSPLFEELLGEWTGVQTISGEEVTFGTTISQTELNFNYRLYNQLAIKFTGGFNGAPYYDAQFLIANEWTEAEAVEDYGPKLLLNIEADQSMWIDGTLKQTSFYNWSQAGFIYMLGCDGRSVYYSDNFVVTLSEDKNTLTISHPTTGVYPTRSFQKDGQWQVSGIGGSDIVLTRGATPAAPRIKSAAKPVKPVRKQLENVTKITSNALYREAKASKADFQSLREAYRKNRR